MKTKVLVIGVNQKLAERTARAFHEKNYMVYTAILHEGVEVRSAEIEKEESIPAYRLNVLNHKEYSDTVEAMKRDIEVLDYLIIQEDDGQEVKKDKCGVWDFEKMTDLMEHKVCSIKMLIDLLIPIMRTGEKKRIALLSGRESGISGIKTDEICGFYLAQSALHMMMKIYFNILRPEGFTFRCFCVSDSAVDGKKAYKYITMDFSYDARAPYEHSEENRFVMRNSDYVEIPW